MAETNNAVLKSNPTVTVDLTEGSSTDSPLAKKLKTFDMEKFIMWDKLLDGEINYAQWLLKTKHSKVSGLQFV